jgi:uncharacterized protein
VSGIYAETNAKPARASSGALPRATGGWIEANSATVSVMSTEPIAGAEPTSEEKNWGVAAHLSSFVAAYVALGILGPVVVYFVKGQQSPFVRAHAVEAINFNITALIGIIVSAVLLIVGIGVILLGIIGIVYLITTIRGAMAASKGMTYRYPLTIRFIS